MNQCFNRSRRPASEPSLDDRFTSGRHHDHQSRIHDGTCRQNGQNDEPEPQEDVNLLIENVERKHTQRIVLLDAARASVFVEAALCQSREHLNHWIGTILLVHVGEFEDVSAVRQKRTAQELVHDDDVGHHIHEIQYFTEEIPKRIAVVCAQAVDDVIDEATLTFAALTCVQCQHATQALRDHADFALFPVLPNPMRHVEENALQKELD